MLISSLLGSDLFAVLHLRGCCGGGLCTENASEEGGLSVQSGCCWSSVERCCTADGRRLSESAGQNDSRGQGIVIHTGGASHDQDDCAVCRAIRLVQAGGCFGSAPAAFQEVVVEPVVLELPLFFASAPWGTGATRGPPQA